MTGLPVASIVGAPISGLILDHARWWGVSSWRWLLILEGLPSIVGEIFTYFLLPGRPAEAGFPTPDEKEWIASQLKREERQKPGNGHASAAQAFTDVRVWHLAATAFVWDIGLYWMSFFMPQKLNSLSVLYSNTVVGFLVMIPRLAGLIGMVLVPRSSDRKLERRYHAAIPAMAGGVALRLLSTAGSPLVSIAILPVMAAGIYSFIAPFFAMPSEFLKGVLAASGIALIKSVANLGAFVGPYVIGVINGRTGELNGGMVFSVVSLLVCAGLASLLPGRRLAG